MSKTKEIPDLEMSALNLQEILNLASHPSDSYLVLSLYVNADARTQEVVTTRSRAHAFLHQAHGIGSWTFIIVQSLFLAPGPS